MLRRAVVSSAKTKTKREELLLWTGVVEKALFSSTADDDERKTGTKDEEEITEDTNAVTSTSSSDDSNIIVIENRPTENHIEGTRQIFPVSDFLTENKEILSICGLSFACAMGHGIWRLPFRRLRVPSYICRMRRLVLFSARSRRRDCA